MQRKAHNKVNIIIGLTTALKYEGVESYNEDSGFFSEVLMKKV